MFRRPLARLLALAAACAPFASAAQPPTASVARERIVMQGLHVMDRPVTVHALGDGRLLLGDRDGVSLVDANDRIVERFALPGGATVLDVDADGTFVVTDRGSIDRRTGTVVEYPPIDRAATADATAGRYLEATQDGSVTSTDVRDARTARPVGFVGVIREMLRLPAEETRAASFTLHSSEAAIDGGTAIVVVHAGSRPGTRPSPFAPLLPPHSFVCRFVAEGDRRGACAEAPLGSRLASFDEERGELLLATDDALIRLDPRTLAESARIPLPGRFLAFGPDRSHASVETPRGIVLVSAERGAEVAGPIPSGTRHLLGRDFLAVVEGRTVTFHRASRPVETATLAAEPEAPNLLGAGVDGPRVVVVSGTQGIARLAAGDRDVAFRGPRRLEARTLVFHAEALVIENGASSRAFPRHDLAPSLDGEGPFPYAELAAALEREDEANPPPSGRSLFAVASPRSPRVAVARLRGNVLETIAVDRSPAAPPIRMPGWFRGAECEAIDFLTDTLVVISGEGRCTAARIDLPARRVTRAARGPTWFAYANDGRHVLWLEGGVLARIDSTNGATVGSLAITTTDPEYLDLSHDARRVAVHGASGIELVAFDPDPAAPSGVVARRAHRGSAPYFPAIDRRVRCDGTELVFEDPWAEREVARVRSPGCPSFDGTRAASLFAVDGYLLHGAGGRNLIVRMRDLAVLDLEIFVDGTSAHILLRRDDVVLGVSPRDSRALAVQRADGRGWEGFPAGGVDVDATIERFFGAP